MRDRRRHNLVSCLGHEVVDECNCLGPRAQSSCRVGQTPTVGEVGETWVRRQSLYVEEGRRHPVTDVEEEEEDGSWLLPRSSGKKVGEL